MSSGFAFDIAGPEDDAQLRARMAEDRMEGDIAVSFRREPSFFAGSRVQGDVTTVMKCVERGTGRIVGLGSRSTFHAYVDGHPRRIGYLADLRGAPEYRNGTLLARGFRFLAHQHARDPVPFYLTVIYEGNTPAMRSLLGGRAGLPLYVDQGRILTPAIHLDFERPAIALDRIEMRRGHPALLREIVDFLNRWQSRKQFAPVYRESDFGTGRFAGLGAEDFFVATAGGAIAGVMAAWDQSAMRQTHVERYSTRLALLRPFYNLAARVTPLKPLPAPGARIPFVYIACIATRDNDTGIARALLRFAYNALRRGPWHYAIAGLHEADPLSAILADYRHVPAAGRLFVVQYPQEREQAAAAHGPGTPYLEAGCL